MPTRNVALIVGSLRKDSLNRKVGHAIASMAAPDLAIVEVPIRDLPLYDEDVEAAGAPAPWTAFRDAVKAADAVLFCTPEYNRSIPGGLKNAIDVGSRPWGKSVWAGKPTAIVSASPGAIGGFGANHHLRQPMVHLDAPLLQQPEMYLGQANKLFDDRGQLQNDDVRKLIEKFVRAFGAWIERTRTA